MKLSFKFCNLLGAVYRKGNINFSSDGSSILAPVGNRLNVYDLKRNQCETLPLESEKNITTVAISPDGYTCIAVNEDGEALLINLSTKSVLRRHHFLKPINDIRFSPDGRQFLVTRDSMVQLFSAPGRGADYNPFHLLRTYYGAYDATLCLDWTSDSQAFLVGSADMNTRVFGAQRFRNLIVYSVGGQNDAVVAAFFEADSLTFYSISRNGQIAIWECDTALSGLIPFKEELSWEDSSDDEGEELEEDEGSKQKGKKRKSKEDIEPEGKALWKKKKKHKYSSSRGEGAGFSLVSSATYSKSARLLCTCFEDGIFVLHEMPDFNLIHSLSVSDQAISAATLSPSADWLALGCGGTGGAGQLLVWEWQSESYVMKQQSHGLALASCIDYSPTGEYVVTGAADNKVKLWSVLSGNCFVTFSEHSGHVTGVRFTQSGRAVVSSSLDGTVRAFDLQRYRNFRTMATPHPAQLSCVCVDPSGEVVCAGGADTFHVYVWSLQTGKLLEVLSGHAAPVSSVCFSPQAAVLASGSWDGSLRLWDVFESKGAREVQELNSDVLHVCFRPDGKQLAVATLNAKISLWDMESMAQLGTIDGRHDLGYGRRETDKITGKKAAEGRAFNSLCYSADGRLLLAGGMSQHVCIYSAPDKLLVKRFPITCNKSLDAMDEMLDRRKMTAWGSLALVEEDTGTEISLPGVKQGEHSSRKYKPEVRVAAVAFAPTGRSWVAATTEGVVYYSLDSGGPTLFDPFDLDIDVTPANIRKALNHGDLSAGLVLSLRLNELPLVQQALETVPYGEVAALVSGLSSRYIQRLLHVLPRLLSDSPHVQFYLHWARQLLWVHGLSLKASSAQIIPQISALQSTLAAKQRRLASVCNETKHQLQYLVSVAQLRAKSATSSAVLDIDVQDNSEQEAKVSELDDVLSSAEDNDDSMPDVVPRT